MDQPMQWIRARLGTVRRLVHDRVERGDSRWVALFVRPPQAIARRGYWKFSQLVNGRLLRDTLNQSGLSRFQAGHGLDGGGHIYVIVMPGILHFLLPCLSLVPVHVRIVLLANGAEDWECRVLEQQFPHFPMFKLRRLPGSALSHADVLTLLLTTNHVPFGILDHDAYIFDPAVYDSLQLRPDELALALFWERGQQSGRPYAHTFFLYLCPQHLRKAMQRFDIDARVYREIPPNLRQPLAPLGYTKGQFPRDNLDYFDTLQLLFVATQSMGFHWRTLDIHDPHDAIHVGGTSFSAHGTKDVQQLYIHLKFLELATEDVKRHYASLVEPFRDAGELGPRLCQSEQGRQLVMRMDLLVDRLKAVFSDKA